MKIKIGTNRFVLLTKHYAYKFPLFLRGLAANKNEYENYLSAKQFVAFTEKHWWGLKQERLTNIVIYSLKTKKNEIAPEHQFLFDKRVHNRMQIGQDLNGVWKFFDYEEVKHFLREGH